MEPKNTIFKWKKGQILVNTESKPRIRQRAYKFILQHVDVLNKKQNKTKKHLLLTGCHCEIY